MSDVEHCFKTTIYTITLQQSEPSLMLGGFLEDFCLLWIIRGFCKINYNFLFRFYTHSRPITVIFRKTFENICPGGLR